MFQQQLVAGKQQMPHRPPAINPPTGRRLAAPIFHHCRGNRQQEHTAEVKVEWRGGGQSLRWRAFPSISLNPK